MIREDEYETVRPDLQTGDLVFFSGRGPVSNVIKLATSSRWSHVGMVICAPVLDMIVLWESTTLCNVNDVLTGLPTRGVQVTALSKRLKSYDGEYGFRHLGLPQKCHGYEKIIGNLRRELDGKPYEENEWQLMKSAFDCLDFTITNTDLSSVFCSELCAEALIRCGVLPPDIPSCAFSPADLADYDYY